MRVPKLILLEQLHGLGWPGLAGGALVLASVAYGVAVLRPAAQQHQAARQQVAEAEALQARRDSGDAPAPQSPAEERAAFYRQFPAQADATRWIERIYRAAAAEKLALTRGEYVLVPVPDSGLWRYQITLPVRGSYGHIRRFIAATLAGVPNLQLDDLSLQRQNIGDNEVEGRIRLSLFLVRP